MRLEGVAQRSMSVVIRAFGFVGEFQCFKWEAAVTGSERRESSYVEIKHQSSRCGCLKTCQVGAGVLRSGDITAPNKPTSFLDEQDVVCVLFLS